MDNNPVTHNEAKGQFEITLGNEKARAAIPPHRAQHHPHPY